MKKASAFVTKAVAFARSPQGKRDYSLAVTAVTAIVALLKAFKGF